MKKIRKSGKLVHGVGVNDADYNVCPIVDGKVVSCPYYDRWAKMLRRCYSKKFHKTGKTYVDCVVCEEWKTFSRFKMWMETQNWEGMDLDKDLLSNSKTYSPDTCVFIPASINRVLQLSDASRGRLPVGVTQSSRYSYLARCGISGERKRIGVYPTPQLAHKAWQLAKVEAIRCLVDIAVDVRVKESLCNVIGYLLDDISCGKVTTNLNLRGNE